MSSTAKIIQHSVNPDGQQIVTYLCRYPRYIHAEIMTARALSRNAASSRAIPIKRMIEDVRTDPAIPAQWGKNQPGMQSFIAMGQEEAAKAKEMWLELMQQNIFGVQIMSDLGVHKQWANRPLEAFSHITVLITATEWGNFFNLRAHSATHPDFQQLAYRMLWRLKHSKPKQLAWGEWHIPFGDQMPDEVPMYPRFATAETVHQMIKDWHHGDDPGEFALLREHLGWTDDQYLHWNQTQEVPHPSRRALKPIDLESKLKIATARSARTSYLTHEGVIDAIKDFEIYEKLIGPGHMSPFEHCAQAEPVKPSAWQELKALISNLPRGSEAFTRTLAELEPCVRRDQGNFSGFTQLRKKLPNENRVKMSIDDLLATKPNWIELDA